MIRLRTFLLMLFSAGAVVFLAVAFLGVFAAEPRTALLFLVLSAVSAAVAWRLS